MRKFVVLLEFRDTIWNMMAYKLNVCEDKWTALSLITSEEETSEKFITNVVVNTKSIDRKIYEIKTFRLILNFPLISTLFLIHISFKALRNKSWNPFNVQKKIKIDQRFHKREKRGKHVLKAHCKQFSIASQSTPAMQKVIKESS